MLVHCFMSCSQCLVPSNQSVLVGILVHWQCNVMQAQSIWWLQELYIADCTKLNTPKFWLQNKLHILLLPGVLRCLEYYCTLSYSYKFCFSLITESQELDWPEHEMELAIWEKLLSRYTWLPINAFHQVQWPILALTISSAGSGSAGSGCVR